MTLSRFIVACCAQDGCCARILRTARVAFFIGAMASVSATVSAEEENGFRLWTDVEGRPLRATLSHVDGEKVTLILEGGREAEVALDRLSEEDRDYLEARRARGLAFETGDMPEETSIDMQVEVSGGPREFATPHFSFLSSEAVSRGFVMEASRVFEGTHEALLSLPLGLDIRPPRGRERFRAHFLGRREFAAELRERVGIADAGGVAGVYLVNDKVVLVPYGQLGVQRHGSRFTLRKSSDTSTLVHEIVHQLMHEWLAYLPMWLGEGLAEYLAAVPYQNGRFEFRNAERGLRERVAQHYGADPGELVLRSPGMLLDGAKSDWKGTERDYLESLLLVYYFMHLDRPEAPGAPLAAYFRLVDEAREETGAKLVEYNEAVRDYNDRVRRYNEEVDRFKIDYLAYETLRESYNERVGQYNQQVREGVGPEERLEVGDEPAAPRPPEKPAVPEILEAPGFDGPLDLAAAVNGQALPALVRDRGAGELARDMERAFAEEGFGLRFR